MLIEIYSPSCCVRIHIRFASRLGLTTESKEEKSSISPFSVYPTGAQNDASATPKQHIDLLSLRPWNVTK